jgi:hypothetical protein
MESKCPTRQDRSVRSSAVVVAAARIGRAEITRIIVFYYSHIGPIGLVYLTVTKAESGVVKSESLLGLKPAYAKPRLRCMRAANTAPCE